MNALPVNLSPAPDDSEDVVSALETADIFWTKGDMDEAMRWLKRASDSAMDAGNELRGIAIMRSVADLKSAPTRVVETPAVAPKMSRPPPPSAIRAPSPPSSIQGPDSRRGPPPLPSVSAPSGGDAAVRTHTSTAPHKAALPAPSSKTRDSAAPPAPSPRHSTAPPPAPEAAAPPKRSPSTDRMTAVSAEATRTATASSQVSRAAEPAVHAARRSVPAAANLPKEPQRALTPATAYRALSVFVKPQGRNGDKLEVILAKPGQAVPAGAEPALLVPLRRGGRLVS